ncbi:WD40 repeat domain-containing protein, partial [Rhizobium ruizarguesonis]
MPTVSPLDLDGHVLAVEFLGDVPFFSSANGTFHRLDGGDR